MEGYKHFSHTHNLMLHEMPEGAEISCSGCNSSAMGTVYVCWQCNYFLHEQCFRASRSLKHPSHPSHPLTLVPFPTYPSNSFYCNSCSIIGTGFSYGCSDCEFDLHVQRAYSIFKATIPQSYNHYSVPNQTHGSNPHQNPTDQPIPNSYPTHHSVANNYILNSFPAHHSIPNNPIPNSFPTHHSIPTSAVSDYASVPDFGAQSHSYMPQIGTPQPIPSAPIQTYPTKNDATPSFNAPPVVSSNGQKPTKYSQSGENETKINQGIMHFSHPHGLRLINLKVGENQTACFACEETLVGSGYTCTESKCDFHLHSSCFKLAKEIQHKSHPKHPLTLLSSPPYESGGFTCNACFGDGAGFTYHCSVCTFDLHVKCTSLPETMKRDDHEHPLVLVYSCPIKGEEYTFFCDKCHGVVHKDCWAYYCKECDYGTHVNCLNCKESPPVEESSDSTGDPVLDAQLQLQRLQLQMEMSRQHALLISQMGQSVLSLI